jgi:hypothetical protein
LGQSGNTGNGKCEISNDFRNWVILFTKTEEKKLKEISPISKLLTFIYLCMFFPFNLYIK